MAEPALPPSIHRQILSIAVPAILANFSAALPGLADTAFIGQYADVNALGGIAIGNRLAYFALWAFGFLRLSAGGLTAQAYGAGNMVLLLNYYYQALLVALIGGCVIWLLAFPIGYFTLPLFKADMIVTQEAQTFWLWRSFSAPFDFMLFAILGTLIGLQRAGTALFLEALLNISNVTLCYLFVALWGGGVKGAALATSLAQIGTAIIALAIMQGILKNVTGGIRPKGLFQWAAVKTLLALNRDIFFRTLALLFMLTYFIGLSVPFGPTILAANHILFSLVTLIAFLIDGFTQAAEALTGHAIGAKNRNALERAIFHSSLWSFFIAALLSLALFMAGESLLSLFSSDPEIIEAAARFYPWLIAAPLVSVACFQLDGIFFGATRGKEMRNSMLFAAIGSMVIAHLTLPFIGNHAIWLGWTSLILLRTVTLYGYYPRISKMISGS